MYRRLNGSTMGAMVPYGSENTIRLDLPATYQFLPLTGKCVRALLEVAEQPADETIAYNIELAVYETCTNIVEHAYGGASGNPHCRIEFVCALQDKPRSLVIIIRDTGQALKKLNEPSIPEPGQSGGYGLFLVYQLMDEVHYHSDAQGNRWQLVKHL